MANWYDTYWNGLKAAITTAWPEVPAGNLWVDVQAAKRDWSNLLDSKQMDPPWVICKLNPQPSTDWGTGAPRYAVETTVFYVTADSADTGGVRIVNYVMGRVIALQGAVLASDALGTVQPEITPNANADNPIENEMLAADQRFTAASLTFTAIVVSGDYS